MATGKALPEIPKAVGERSFLPGTGLNPVARHGMDQVINGIETQKDEDKKILGH